MDKDIDLCFLFSVLKPERAEIIPLGISKKGKLACCQLSKAIAAIDKDISTRVEITISEGESEAWLKLEFGKIRFIHEVQVYFRFYTDWYRGYVECAKSENKFVECVDNENDVELSVYQGEDLQKVCGTFQRTYGLEQSNQTYTLPCNAEGDSVELRKTTEQILGIFEVVVTGKSISFLAFHLSKIQFYALHNLQNRKLQSWQQCSVELASY